MKMFKAIDIGMQTIIICYIFYIIAFRFTINWDFILAFIGLGVLMIWQVVSYIVLLNRQGKLPQRIIYIICMIIFIFIIVCFYEAKTNSQTRLLFIVAITLASYYYAISIIEFFINPLKIK
jgi:hypothetical protein